MAKNLAISLLLDFYGEMLTDKQKDAIILYYNEDLSLAEIAEHCNITRQGVRDSIKRAEMQLLTCESRLGLAKRFRRMENGLEKITTIAKEIESYATQYGLPGEISVKAGDIVRTAAGLND